MLLKWMDDSGIDGNDTLVAFDFDFTLKGAPDPATQEAAIRDETNTLGALNVRALVLFGFVESMRTHTHTHHVSFR